MGLADQRQTKGFSISEGVLSAAFYGETEEGCGENYFFSPVPVGAALRVYTGHGDETSMTSTCSP